MNSINPWDDPDLAGGDFYRFDNAGDKAAGTITRIGKYTFEGSDRPVPQLTLKDDATGEDMVLTAKQMQLKAKLQELRPGVGDHLTVDFTHEEKRDGGKKTLKCFTVVVNGGSAPAVAPVAPPAAVAAPVAAEPVAAVAQAAAIPADAQAAIEALRLSDPKRFELLFPQAAAQV